MTELLPRAPHTLSVDVEEMDGQHRGLVDVMDELARRDAQRAPKQELSALLQRLADCTLQHFEAEEAYMARTGYPKLDTHCIIHRSLLAALNGHLQTFEAGGGRLGHKLLSFMKYWLVAHINSVDRHSPSSRPRSA
jgi:hemerythrin-like metal-binding protein